MDSGDPGERQLRPSAVWFRPPTLGGGGPVLPQPRTATPFEADAEATRPQPCPGSGPGLQRPERSSSAMLSIHIRARRWSPGLGRLAQATGGSRVR